MKIITCPVNGPRAVTEFVYWGEVREMPDPKSISDDALGPITCSIAMRAGREERVVVPRAEQTPGFNRRTRHRARHRCCALTCPGSPADGACRRFRASGSTALSPRQFRFEGATAQGFAGDTISSALWAQGVLTLGRSFKYHRPRGLLSFANHDANVVMQQGEPVERQADLAEPEPSAELTAGQYVRRAAAGPGLPFWAGWPACCRSALLHRRFTRGACSRVGADVPPADRIGPCRLCGAPPAHDRSGTGSATCW